MSSEMIVIQNEWINFRMVFFMRNQIEKTISPSRLKIHHKIFILAIFSIKPQ